MIKKVAYIVLVLFVLACNKHRAFDCFKGDKRQLTVSRSLTPFKRMSVYGNIDVSVFQAAEFKVELLGAQKLVNDVLTEIDTAQNLSIADLNGCAAARGYRQNAKLTVYTPSLVTINHWGAGTLRIDKDFVSDSISLFCQSSGGIDLKGTYRVVKTVSNDVGDITLQGTSDELYVYSNYINYVNAAEMKVRNFTFIHWLSDGKCTVTGEGLYHFACNIEGNGNIYLQGTPTLITNYTTPAFSGKLIRQ